MRRRRRLSVVFDSFQRNLARQEARFQHALLAPDLRLREQSIAQATIESLNSWRNFIRAYYESCFLYTRRKSGGRVTVGRPVVGSDPLGFAVMSFKPSVSATASGRWKRRDEPPWHDPNTLLQLAHAAGFSNAADIAAAFSIGSRVFVDLPVFRNYFAHRNLDSWRSATQLGPVNGVPILDRPSQMLVSTPVGASQALLREWMSDLFFVAEYLCD
jgi:hypothetical protein